MKSVKISYRGLRIWAFLFLLLPVIIFLLFFVRRVISIPVSALLVAAYRFAIREETGENQTFEISGRRLILFLALCGLWCFLGGQGGLFFQTSDWNERNAIFRDLITRPWPVYYPATDTTLTYYIGHWLPAALLGRLIYLLSGDADLAFSAGNILLALWTLFGVMVTLLLHICSAKPGTRRGQWLIFLLFIGFSGMDIVGWFLKNQTWSDMFQVLHLEWWADSYQYSSNTTCLFWVFNQAVTAWIATLCFFNEKNNRSYALIIGCSLLSASLPCVGLAVLMVGKVICDAVSAYRNGQLARYVKRTFSFANVVTAGCWVPIIGLYLMSNSALKNTPATAAKALLWQVIQHLNEYIVIVPVVLVGAALAVWIYLRFLRKNRFSFLLCCGVLLAIGAAVLYRFPDAGGTYVSFLLLECGLYWLLLAPDFRGEPLYGLIGLLFVICPWVRVGKSADFCMRASIPALTILMIFCGKKLCAWLESDHRAARPVWSRISCSVLALFLVIGLATPAMEVYRGVGTVLEQKQLALPADNIRTLNKRTASGGIYSNFVSESYKDSLFFKYFSLELQDSGEIN